MEMCQTPRAIQGLLVKKQEQCDCGRGHAQIGHHFPGTNVLVPVPGDTTDKRQHQHSKGQDLSTKD